jgi:hypothetical protein
MAKDSIADLNIAIRATADKLSSDINRGIKGAEQSTSVSAVALGTAIGTSVVAGLSAAMAGVKNAVGLAFEGLDRIDALDEAASKIGITYNALQDLKFAAEMTGGSFEGMVSAIAKMQANISSGSATEALQKLGLSAEYLKQLAPEKQFAEINQRLSEIKNTGEKIDLTKGLYGKGGVELLNVINSGKDGLTEMSRQVELFGGHLTDAQRSMATMAQEDIEKLQAGWGYIKDQIAVGVAPALTGITESIVKMAEKSGGLSQVFEGMAGKLVEVAAFSADFLQSQTMIYQVMKAIGDADIWSTNPVTMYQNALKVVDEEMKKILLTTETAGSVIRRTYEERTAAAEVTAATEKKAATDKIQQDNDVANNFGDTTEEMTRAYEAQMEANRLKTEEFHKTFNDLYDAIPGRVKGALEEIVAEYTGTTKTLEDLLMSWIKATVGSWVDITTVIGSSLFTSAGALWSDANEILQSFGSRRKFGEADGQATLDSMRTNKVELSPAEAAMAKSAASREASQAREAARVSANRADSAAKSAARQAGIGGGMKIGSFDGSFTSPSMNGQSPSFFGGGGMRSPRMNTAASGGVLGGVTINQSLSFSTGVTRAELAGSMDEMMDKTRLAVAEGVSRGGGYRSALQA